MEFLGASPLVMNGKTRLSRTMPARQSSYDSVLFIVVSDLN
jgi:hypothetical protein